MNIHKISSPVNIGNPDEITMLDLVNEAKKIILDTKSEIIFKPLPKDDPTKRKPDITKAITELKWKPITPLQDGLRQTIDYYRSEQ